MGIEIQGINPELSNMIQAGQLSGAKMAGLIRLKATVDRYARKPYVSAEEVAALKAKFGEEPDIITWGDFFQTEIGSRYFMLSDEEFGRIIDTVHFDLISSCLIFTGKPAEFMDLAAQEGLSAFGTDREEWTEKHAEDAHLYILLQYFAEMDLDASVVTADDHAWFEGFVGHSQYAVG